MAVYTPADNTELAAITTADGDTVLFSSGVTYSAAAVPASLLSPRVTLGMIGTGAKPIISGGTLRTDWSYDAGNDVYSRPAYSVGAFLGNVTEDGVPMRFTAWNANIATTAASMTAGQSLPAWSGSMTFDLANRIIYIRPSSGTASEHQYIVSDAGTLTGGNGIANSVASTQTLIDSLDVRHVSRHGILLYRKLGLRITNVDLRYIGGARPSTLYMGNGIELSFGTDGAYVQDCTATDIFDTGYTSQLYEVAPITLGGHKWVRNSCLRYGLHGFEISTQTAGNNISDVQIIEPSVSDAGTYSWAGDRNGAAVTVLSNALNTGRITRCFSTGLTGSRNKRAYLGYQHGGVNGIEDSATTLTWGQAPQSSANGATNQRDLHRGITDNLGAPTGGVWVPTTGRLRDHFAPIYL